MSFPYSISVYLSEETLNPENFHKLEEKLMQTFNFNERTLIVYKNTLFGKRRKVYRVSGKMSRRIFRPYMHNNIWALYDLIIRHDESQYKCTLEIRIEERIRSASISSSEKNKELIKSLMGILFGKVLPASELEKEKSKWLKWANGSEGAKAIYKELCDVATYLKENNSVNQK